MLAYFKCHALKDQTARGANLVTNLSIKIDSAWFWKGMNTRFVYIQAKLGGGLFELHESKRGLRKK